MLFSSLLSTHGCQAVLSAGLMSKCCRGGIQKQVATAAAPGLHEAAARKKKVPMNYFCPPQKICPTLFSAYTE